MIKLETKIVKENDDITNIEIKKYKTKHTNAIEHICAIGVLVNAIMENTENMSITKLCKLIKDNYNLEKEVN